MPSTLEMRSRSASGTWLKAASWISFASSAPAARGAVGQHAVEDLVELRLAFAPIGSVALQPVIFAGLVLGEFERAGADELVVGGVGRDVRMPSKICLATTLVTAGSALRMSWNGVGLENLKIAVCSSGVSTASRLAKTRRPRFCSGFHTCSAEKATSAEVKGLPSCQVTPSRSLKVTDRPSAEPSQTVASRGASPFSPSKEASASGSITLLAMKKTPFDATIAGLRFFGSESAATIRRPPPAHPGRKPRIGMAVEARSSAVLCSSVRRERKSWDMVYSGKRREREGFWSPSRLTGSTCIVERRGGIAPGMEFRTDFAGRKFLTAFKPAGAIRARGAPVLPFGS